MKCNACGAAVAPGAGACAACGLNPAISARELAERYGPGDDVPYALGRFVTVFVAKLAMLAGGISAVMAGLAAFYVPGLTWAWNLGVSGAAVCGAGVVLFLLGTRQRNALPMLQSTLAGDRVVAFGDVEATIDVEVTGVPAGIPVPIHVRLQNCVNRHRVVHVGVVAGPERSGWLFNPGASGVLGPADCALVTLWVMRSAGAAASVELTLIPTSSGPAGRRVRKGRSTQVGPQGPIGLALDLALGSSLAIRFHAVEVHVGETRPLAPPRWETVWTPSREDLVSA